MVGVILLPPTTTTTNDTTTTNNNDHHLKTKPKKPTQIRVKDIYKGTTKKSKHHDLTVLEVCRAPSLVSLVIFWWTLLRPKFQLYYTKSWAGFPSRCCFQPCKPSWLIHSFVTDVPIILNPAHWLAL